jgi:hypothetical protein
MFEPTLLLDKSTFQELSKDEHIEIMRSYRLNVPPILASEILADLSKNFKGGASADSKVAEFARKFGGSGDPVNVDWNILCGANLGGNFVEMRGVTVVGDFTETRTPDGEPAIFMEPGPINRSFLRWARGQFSDAERMFAQRWRQRMTTMSAESLWQRLWRRRILVPRPTSREEVAQVADDVLARAMLQDDLLEYLLEQILPSPPAIRMIQERWLTFQPRLLSRFAPYAYHCLRAQLVVMVASRHKLITPKASDMLDAQYLYYLPFCQIFASSDRLHRLLAPLLINAGQTFLAGQDLKAQLRQAVVDRNGRRDAAQQAVEADGRA